jgi:hypothetical protein
MSVRPEVVLLLGAGGVGLLALLFPLLLRQDDPRAPLSWPRLAVAAVVIVLLFGLTRLSAYPFSPGGTLGNGLLLGGTMALVTVMLASLWPGTAVAAVGAGGGALLGAAVVLLWHRGYPSEALVGFGAGHAIATLLVCDGEGDEGAPSGLWAGPVVAALVAGAALLAIIRAGDISSAERLALEGKAWWAWPLAVAATALAGQMVGLSVFARRAWAPAGAGLVAALLLLLLWLRFPRYGALLGPVAAGFVTAWLLLLTSGVQVFKRRVPAQRVDVQGNHPDDPHTGMGERLNALLALLAPGLALVLLAAAYRLYTGYGIALAALGALVLLPWLAEREPVALGRAFFGLLSAGVLFRVYYHAYDLGNNDIPLTAHYALVGLLAGALAPFAWGVLQSTVDSRQSTEGSSGAWLLSPVACLLAAALPLLLAVFWGEKVGGGLLLGLAVGQGYRMMAALLEAEAPGALGAIAAAVPEAALLVMGWVAVQILDWGANFGLQLLRVQRIGIVAALVALCFVAILFFNARRPHVRY